MSDGIRRAGGGRAACHVIARLRDMADLLRRRWKGGRMLVGYMRVSKADGSQVSDLQRDALLAAGVDPRHLYEDAASGRRDDRPGLAACLKALRQGDALVVWKL